MNKKALIATAFTALCLTQPALAELNTQNEKLSYFLGTNIGTQFKSDGIQLDKKAFLQAIDDVYQGKKPQLTDAQMTEVFQAFQAGQAERAKQQAEENDSQGKAFLAKNKTKSTVKTTGSGLQYEVIKDGQGPRPGPDDMVEVHYHGTLIDGTVFDSSVERGTPAQFPVGRVIRGWTEALQLMSVGSKWRLYIPSELAYGKRGTSSGSIGPNATLIFDVELLSIK